MQDHSLNKQFTSTIIQSPLEFKSQYGLLVAGMLTEVGGQMGWLASVMNFRFKKPVYFGDTITCKLTLTDIDDRNRARAFAEYKNDDGVRVLEADLEGIVPAEPEQEVLYAMVQEGDPTNRLFFNLISDGCHKSGRQAPFPAPAVLL
jgi:hypothetical protein